MNIKKNVEEDVESRPDWLPDGWIMEIKHGEDGAPYEAYQSCIHLRGSRLLLTPEPSLLCCFVLLFYFLDV
jgi:hypothetical protein